MLRLSAPWDDREIDEQMTAAVAADHQVQAERVLRNVSSALMQILVTSVAVLTMFLTFSYFSFRKDEKKRQDRRSIDLEEFAKAEGFESIKAPVLQAVFAELSRTLGYPPVASDLIGSDLGIDGSDIDDLILSLSDKLQITWDQPEPIETGARTVADLVQFMDRYYRTD